MFFKLPIHKSYCKSITKNLEIIVYFPPTIPTTYKTAHATLTLLQSTKVFSFEKLTGIVSTWMLDMPVHSSKENKYKGCFFTSVTRCKNLNHPHSTIIYIKFL